MIITTCVYCQQVIRLDTTKLSIWIDDKGGGRCDSGAFDAHMPPSRYVILQMVTDEMDRADAENNGFATPFEYMENIVTRLRRDLDERAAEELSYAGKHRHTEGDN